MNAFSQDPTDADGWYQLAVTSREAKHYDAAHNALNNAERLGYSGIRLGFERARLHTLVADPDKAMAELEAVVAAGFPALGFILNDPILSTLAGNAGYDQMVAELSVTAYPCEHDEAFAAFDFWIGDWVVHDASGNLQGTNTIERSERSCVLIENWTSASGGTGMSVNYLDKITDEWVQVWNSEGGGQINIRGGMTDEGMLLVGTLHDIASDTTQPFRGLWTALDDGRVRQYFEQSSDGGETWTPWFEGFYTRTE